VTQSHLIFLNKIIVKIGKNNPTYIIAELSCNHNQDINLAYQLIDAAAQAGADAVKLQTYTGRYDDH